DIYEESMIDKNNDSNYRPAQNVRKGYLIAGGDESGDSCTAGPAPNWPVGSPPSQVTGLPLDRQWEGRVGDGNWDFDMYWEVNHGGRPPPMVNGRPADNANLLSRYDVYRYEIDQ